MVVQEKRERSAGEGAGEEKEERMKKSSYRVVGVSCRSNGKKTGNRKAVLRGEIRGDYQTRRVVEKWLRVN